MWLDPTPGRADVGSVLRDHSGARLSRKAPDPVRPRRYDGSLSDRSRGDRRCGAHPTRSCGTRLPLLETRSGGGANPCCPIGQVDRRNSRFTPVATDKRRSVYRPLANDTGGSRKPDSGLLGRRPRSRADQAVTQATQHSVSWVLIRPTQTSAETVRPQLPPSRRTPAGTSFASVQGPRRCRAPGRSESTARLTSRG